MPAALKIGLFAMNMDACSFPDGLPLDDLEAFVRQHAPEKR